MSGIMELSTLLATMSPRLRDGIFVFVTVQSDRMSEFLSLRPLGMFLEDEGLTLILEQDIALSAGLDGGLPLKMITLDVHSSLEAVGLTAAFSAALTEVGISANVVAGYFHDHIFVPIADAERAVGALVALSEQSKR